MLKYPTKSRPIIWISVLVSLFTNVGFVYGADCLQQDYSSKTEPNYDCPGPDEGFLVPKLEFRSSVGLDANKAAPFAGVLMEPGQVLQLGLRIKGLRKLRYLDMQTQAARQRAELDLQDKLFSADLKLVESQRKAYEAAAVEFRKELQSERAWYKSWSFGFVLGTVITCVAAVSLAVSVR